MYEDFFGFEHHPFNVTPDPEFIYYSEQHKEALAHMLYGVQERRGFVLITGRVGSGKTTLSRAFLGELDDDTETAVILNSQLPAHDLLLSIAEEFGVNLPISAGRTQVIDSLEKFAREEYDKGKNLCLVIDESQNLSPEALEQLRLLSNIETNKDKLIQTILIGQPELENLLNRSELRQLKQRIAVRSYLTNLNRDETREYILHRLSHASGGGAPAVELSKTIHKRLYEVTDGNPRAINLIGDRMLIAAFREESRQPQDRHLDKAIEDLSGSRDRRNPEDDLVLHRVFQSNSSNGIAKTSWGKRLTRFIGYITRSIPLSRYSSSPLTIVLVTSVITLFLGLSLLGWSGGNISLFNSLRGSNGHLTPKSEEQLTKALTAAATDALPVEKSSKDYTKPLSKDKTSNLSATRSKQFKKSTPKTDDNPGSKQDTIRNKWKNAFRVEPVPEDIILNSKVDSLLGGHALLRYISLYASREGLATDISKSYRNLSNRVVKNSLQSTIPDLIQGQLVRIDEPLKALREYSFPAFLMIDKNGRKRYVLYVPKSDLLWDPLEGAIQLDSSAMRSNWTGKSLVLAQSTLNLNKTIRKGSRGEAVTRLQARLNQAGNFGIPEIGIFGPKTKRSVELFQKDAGINVDGVADPRTKLRLIGNLDRQITWTPSKIDSFMNEVDFYVVD